MKWREPLQRAETWTEVIHCVGLSRGSSSSVLRKLQLSERIRKQHTKKQRHSYTLQNALLFESGTSHSLTLISTSVLWDFSVTSAWECSLSLVMFFTTCEDKDTQSQYIWTGPAAVAVTPASAVIALHLYEGFSFVLLAGVLGQLLQGGGPLGPLLHFDQTGQQADQQKEDQQAQQGDDCHVQSLQLVGCRKWKMEEQSSAAAQPNQ